MSRFIWPSVLILTAAIVAILLARQPRIAAPGHSGTKPIPIRLNSDHADERYSSSGLTAPFNERELQSASRAPLSPAPFSHPPFHGVPGRAASAPPNVPYLTPQPAAWIDLDLSQIIVGAYFNERIIVLAQDVITQTTGLPVAMDESRKPPDVKNSPHAEDADFDLIPIPADSHPNWANAVAESDFRFRQLYGGRLWMAHHLQAHHLAAGNIPGDP